MNKRPMFQKRHYEVIAAALWCTTSVRGAAEHLALVFERDNLRFDRSRFLAKCSGGPNASQLTPTVNPPPAAPRLRRLCPRCGHIMVDEEV